MRCLSVRIKDREVRFNVAGPCDRQLWEISLQQLGYEARGIEAVFFGVGGSIEAALKDAVRNVSRSVAHSHLVDAVLLNVARKAETEIPNFYEVQDKIARMYCMLSIGRARESTPQEA